MELLNNIKRIEITNIETQDFSEGIFEIVLSGKMIVCYKSIADHDKISFSVQREELHSFVFHLFPGIDELVSNFSEIKKIHEEKPLSTAELISLIKRVGNDRYADISEEDGTISTIEHLYNYKKGMERELMSLKQETRNNNPNLTEEDLIQLISDSRGSIEKDRMFNNARNFFESLSFNLTKELENMKIIQYSKK